MFPKKMKIRSKTLQRPFFVILSTPKTNVIQNLLSAVQPVLAKSNFETILLFNWVADGIIIVSKSDQSSILLITLKFILRFHNIIITNLS